MKFTIFYVISLVALSANEVLSNPLIERKSTKHTCSDTKGVGKQNEKGFCSKTAQGDIPSVGKMPSTLIVSPKYNAVLKADEPFNVKVAFKNLATGHFSDPDNQYYTEPQSLNSNGLILGHIHVTVQELHGDELPNAKKFDFFEGLNDDAGSNGHLTAKVTPGLSAGTYRICTLTSTFTHQPVIMPVAKRGPQDDCIRVTVSSKKGSDDDDKKEEERLNSQIDHENEKNPDPFDPNDPLKFDATSDDKDAKDATGSDDKDATGSVDEKEEARLNSEIDPQNEKNPDPFDPNDPLKFDATP